jgi:hypothetical protein
MGTHQPKPESAPFTTLALWTGFLLAPAAWAVHLQLVYAASEQVCKQHLSRATLNAVSVVCVALAVGGGLLATLNWFIAGAKWPSEERSDLTARQRFLSAEGILSGLLFTVVIVAQWLALLYLTPCS